MQAQDEELQMIRDTAERLVREATTAGLGTTRDMAEATWRAVVESGLVALPLPEADGGLGAGATMLCAVAEELGRGLQAGSFLVSHVLVGQWLAAAPKGLRRNAALVRQLDGTRSIALADSEHAARGAPGPVALRARRDGSGWRLDGAKCNVLLDESTDTLLVSAAVEGSAQEILLIELPRLAPGLVTQEFRTVDDGRALDVRFADVAVGADDVLAGPGSGFGTARLKAWDLVLLAEAAECIGLMKALLQRTSEYLAARKQFGQALSRLQVLRHRLADMALARFRAEALVSFAAREFEQLAPSDRARLVAATASKALVGARFVAEQAVQLHGGMGVSEDLPVGRYLRRVLALEATLGTPDFHRGRFEDGAAG